MHDFSHKICFYCWQKLKKTSTFTQTYDVISRNHRNWPTLDLTQNSRKGWTNSYWAFFILLWKRTVHSEVSFIMFIQRYLRLPIFCCMFCGNFWKARKNMLVFKMIHSSYSRSYFNLFLIYTVAHDARKYIPSQNNIRNSSDSSEDRLDTKILSQFQSSR